MNDIIKFYGTYGLETAYDDRRWEIIKSISSLYRKHKEKKLDNIGKLNLWIDDLDKLSIVNLKKEDSKFPYSLEDIKKATEFYGNFKNFMDDFRFVLTNSEEFLTKFTEVIDKEVTAEYIPVNDRKIIISLIKSIITHYGTHKLTDIWTSVSGGINPYRQIMLLGFNAYKAICLLNVAFFIFMSILLRYRKNTLEDKDMTKALNVLDWDNIFDLLNKLVKIPKKADINSDFGLDFKVFDKKDVTITYEEKVELVNALKSFKENNKSLDLIDTLEVSKVLKDKLKFEEVSDINQEDIDESIMANWDKMYKSSLVITKLLEYSNNFVDMILDITKELHNI